MHTPSRDCPPSVLFEPSVLITLRWKLLLKNLLEFLTSFRVRLSLFQGRKHHKWLFCEVR